MNNSPVRLLLFSPFLEINPLYHALADEMGYTLNIKQAEPAQIPELLQHIPKDAYDVFLCRGLNYVTIKNDSYVPVVNIPVSPLDVLQTLLPCKGKIKNAALFGYHTDTRSTEAVTRAINVNITDFRYETQDDIVSLLHAVKASGNIDLVVGQFCCVRSAEALGIPAVRLVESDHTVCNVLAEAIHIAEIRRDARQRYARMETVVNTLDEGLFLLDAHGIIRSLNRTAISYIGKKIEEILGRHGHEVIPESRVRFVLETGHAVRDHLSGRDGKTILWNILPVILDEKPVGVVCQFSEARKVLESGGRVRSGMRSRGFAARYTFDDIKTKSPNITNLKSIAKVYAESESSILITGESGTGKELFAQSIHNASPRAKEPFVAVNCAAIQESLLESELFGYEEGAFTGARRQGKAGLFELAHRGTFFLDEVAEMSTAVQARLLRVLQEKEIVRVGGAHVIPVQVRIICATNQPLKRMVEQKKFREDLYYRLGVLTLHLPPLRERLDDICAVGLPLLMAQLNSPPDMRTLEADLGPLLRQYSWPGNFRELHSTIERLALVANHNSGSTWAALLKQVHAAEVLDFSPPPPPAAAQETPDECQSLKECLLSAEQRIINQRLARFGQDMQRTARSLKISRMTLWRKLQQ